MSGRPGGIAGSRFALPFASHCSRVKREDSTHERASSLAEVLENVFGTVAEIGWSLVAAGRGVLSIASRIVQLAQGQLRGSTASNVAPDAAGPAAPWPTTSPGAPGPRTRPPSSAADLESDAIAADHGRSSHAANAVVAAHAARADSEPPTPPLPTRYGGDRVAALPRDPKTVFAWWDVSPEHRARVASELASIAADGRPGTPPGDALRIAALAAGDGRETGFWFVPLPPLATSWYVDVPRTSRRYEIAIGLLSDGRFAPLAAPVRVDMPAAEPSRDATVRWRTVGESSAAAATEPVPAPAAVEALWQELERRSLPSSVDWPAGRRLVELDVGGSHGLPIG